MIKTVTEYSLKMSTFNEKPQYSLQETFSKNVTIAKTENNISMKTVKYNKREVHSVIYIMSNTPDSSQRHTVLHNKPWKPSFNISFRQHTIPFCQV